MPILSILLLALCLCNIQSVASFRIIQPLSTLRRPLQTQQHIIYSSNSSNNDDNTSTTATITTTEKEPTSSSSSSFYDDIDTYARESRAGEDGYSVLRRPVTFDADTDPTFEAPKVLDESEEEKLNDVNKLWFETSTSSTAASVLGEYTSLDSSDNNSDSKPQPQQQQQHARQNEEDQELDMRQRTHDTLDYPLVLRALANECESVFGKKLVLNSIIIDSNESGNSSRNNNKKSKDTEDEDDILTMPLTASSVEGVHSRYGAVQEMQRLMEGRVSGFVTSTRRNQFFSSSANNSSQSNKKKKKVQKLPLGSPPIAGHALDLQPILDILDEGKVLEGPEILDVTFMLEVALDVQDWCDALKEVNDENDDESDTPTPFVELPKLVQSIEVDDELLTLLSSAFDDEGKLDGVTFPGIGRLRAKVRTYKRDIMTSIDSILAMPSMKNKMAVESGGALTMEINGRLVIPVQQQYQNSVGIVHDASRSGKTCYVEPTEIVGPTNELRQAEAELRSEEARVWRQLTETINEHRIEIERIVASLGHLDIVMGRVKCGKRLRGVVPTVQKEGVVSVKEARHPILLLRELENVVGSDVDIGQDGNQGLILTGPNSGGKTIILVST